MDGRSPPTPGAGVTWIAVPPATMATTPTDAGNAETLSMTTEVQSTLGSLSSTRSTVARPVRTPKVSSTARGTPTGTPVQSGGNRGRSEGYCRSSSVAASSVEGSGGATSAQLSTNRKALPVVTPSVLGPPAPGPTAPGSPTGTQ